MTVGEYTRLVAQIAVLKEVAMQYLTNTIDNIIVQMDRERKKLAIVTQNNKTIKNDSGGNG